MEALEPTSRRGVLQKTASFYYLCKTLEHVYDIPHGQRRDLTNTIQLLQSSRLWRDLHGVILLIAVSLSIGPCSNIAFIAHV
jgi:hypothetical protein